MQTQATNGAPVQKFVSGISPHLSSLRPTEQDILKSKIIARATVRHSHGKFVTIICAFQLSHEFHFWYVFRAKSARTPRRNWRRMSREGVNGYRPTDKITMDVMIDRAVGKDEAAKVTKRYPTGKRSFEANFDRICYPFKYKPTQPLTPITTEYINRKFAAGRRGQFTVGKG